MTDKVRVTSESQAKKPARECEQIAGKKMQAGKLAKMQASRHARKCKLGASKTLQAKRKTRCKCRQKSVKQENAGERADNASRQAEKKCGRVHRTASVKVSKLEKLEIKINKVKLGGRGGLGEEEVRKEKSI